MVLVQRIKVLRPPLKLLKLRVVKSVLPVERLFFVAEAASTSLLILDVTTSGVSSVSPTGKTVWALAKVVTKTQEESMEMTLKMKVSSSRQRKTRSSMLKKLLMLLALMLSLDTWICAKI
ncbi:hypothetical protein KCU71_g103, partial [Aureobasidium melanogenum]